MENHLPSPKDLARKEETRTISLRIKEKTITAFEKFAKQNDTTASSLINGVLDSYIVFWQQKESNESPEQLRKKDDLAARQVMEQYLNKLASRMGKFTNSDLCCALFEEDDEYVEKDGAENANEMAERIKDRDFNELGYAVYPNDSLGRVFCVSPDDVCRKDPNDDFPDCGPTIYIPAKKYPVAAYMILQYVKKSKVLYGENRKVMFSDEIDDQIVAIINNNNCGTQEDRCMMARDIGKVLSNFEGAQDE